MADLGWQLTFTLIISLYTLGLIQLLLWWQLTFVLIISLCGRLMMAVNIHTDNIAIQFGIDTVNVMMAAEIRTDHITI